MTAKRKTDKGAPAGASGGAILPAWFLGTPQRMRETWEWTCALVAFDYGDRGPLAALVTKEPIPPEFTQAVADIMAGTRKPNMRAAAKAKIPATERMRIASSIAFVIGLTEVLRTVPQRKGFTSGAQEIADREGREPIEVVRELQSEAREAVAIAAEELGVSAEAIENLLRELRRRIADWPAV